MRATLCIKFWGTQHTTVQRTDLGTRPVCAVDENLYYRGIHKEEVDHVRRDQTHGIAPETLASPALLAAATEAAGPGTGSNQESAGEAQADKTGARQVPSLPLPYLFRNAAGLVRLTQQHNVSSSRALQPKRSG